MGLQMELIKQGKFNCEIKEKAITIIDKKIE